MRELICLSLALALTGCADPDAGSVTKEEAAELGGGADLGRDFCQEFGWYGDAECDTFCARPDPDCANLRNVDGVGPTLCVGIRGNGQRVTAHWSALARIIEHYGLIDATAGGSSASITAFLLESIEMNPHVTCADCSPEEQAARAALLFKSLQGYIGVLSVSEEALAFRTVAEIYGRIQSDGVETLLESDPTAGVAALSAILENEDLRTLVNPEVLALLRDSPVPEYHARDIIDSVANAASFDASDPTIFVRPGVLSFAGVALSVGRVGSFYAGYEPVDGAAMERFLGACATPSRGMTWAQAAALPAGAATCGDVFSGLLTQFRDAVRVGDYPSRIDDRVGGRIHTLISTSVLTGDAIDVFEAARAQYLAGETVEWTSDFDDVLYGYWGAEEDLARVGENPFGFRDGKTAKFHSLGAASWLEALSYSPAEPGLARALELPDGTVSAGGWSDLQPTLVLRSLGCEQVIYLTRRGGNSTFGVGVATLLGRNDDDHASIFDPYNPASGFATSVADADGVWCTDWDTPPFMDLAAMEATGYDAPFEIRDPRFGEDGAYENISQDLGLLGCSVGVRP